MTVEQTMNDLEKVLKDIDTDDLRDYVSNIDVDDRNMFVINFLYGRKEGKDKGLIPVIGAILESFPIDKIPKKELKDRIGGSGIEKRIEGCNSNIADIREELKTLEQKKEELLELEEEVNRLKDERMVLEGQVGSLKDNERKMEELKEIVEELKEKKRANKSIGLKAGADFDTSTLLENRSELLNYEKFLAACLIGSKMIDSDCVDGSSESKDAMIIHRFMLLKWYLHSSVDDGSVVFSDEEFESRYRDILEKFDSLSEEAKGFFKDYMTASDEGQS